MLTHRCPPHKGVQPLEAPAIGCRQQIPENDSPRRPLPGARLTPTGLVATLLLIHLTYLVHVYCTDGGNEGKPVDAHCTMQKQKTTRNEILSPSKARL